jgi:hypothetical protein
LNKHCKIWMNLLLCVVVFAGCQDEKMQQSFPEPDKIISPGSTTAALIERTVLHDGSFDNILDHASCVSLKLPLTIAIKNQTIQLNVSEDIQALGSHPDKDKIRLIFPVTVVLADYSEVTINDKDNLKSLIKNCVQDNDVECTDFEFPLLIYSYNLDRQLQATHTVENDRALLALMKGFKAEDIMSFKFPFRMKPKGGNSIEIGNNIQLDDHILSFDNGCEEADEVDEPVAVDVDEFIETLTKERWTITYFYIDGDETSEFMAYEFDFRSNKTIQAKKSGVVFGSWDIKEKEDGRQKLNEKEYELEMIWENKYSFPQLEKKWDIISFTDKKINLSYDESILIFER